MNIGVLSTKKTFYSTRRLLESIRKRGHNPLFINPLQCQVLVNGTTPVILYQRKSLPPVDVVLTRIGPLITDYGLALVRQFEFAGIRVINSSASILQSRDKLYSLQMLAAENISIPPTLATRSSKGLGYLIKKLNGPPVILKTFQGTQGLGVMLAESPDTAEALLDTLWGLNQNILLQQYINEARGTDVRIFVVGNSTVAAMRRKAGTSEFRSNIHRGGKGTNILLTEKMQKTVLKAARILGLEIAGIDVLETSSGPLVIEANSSPGFKELERITTLDVAGHIVDYAIQSIQSYHLKK